MFATTNMTTHKSIIHDQPVCKYYRWKKKQKQTTTKRHMSWAPSWASEEKTDKKKQIKGKMQIEHFEWFLSTNLIENLKTIATIWM